MDINMTTQGGVKLGTAGKYCPEDINVIPQLKPLTVTPAKSAQNIAAPDGKVGYSSVTVEKIPDDYIIPSGSQNITANGTYDVASKASVVVNVDTAKPEQTKTVTITENGTITITPDSGKVLTTVTVTTNVPTGVDTSDATAIAADIRLGKTAYAKDVKLTGTIEDYDGAASQGSGNYTVKVIDYDGTVLMEKKGNTGDVIELPEAPTHDRLVFQKWSASRTVTDNKVTIGNDNVMVGATYTTASGQNEFDITVTKVTGLTVTFNGSGVKDWGDGTSDSETSHTYTAYGNYMIKWTGSSVPKYAFGSGISYFLTFARLAGITSISNNALQNCFSLTSITMPESVTSISKYAFYSCYSLTSIIMPESVTSISNYAFANCYSLTSIIMPKSVTVISNYAFQNCYSLKSITMPESVTDISNYAFANCYSLTSIIMPKSVTVISNYAFQNCYSLKSITMPKSVTVISDNAFQNCYSLTSITMPNGVTSIGNSAFYSCNSLIKYDFSQATAVPTLTASNAFNNINKICKIVVPDNLYDQWIAATNWSTYADYIYKASEVVSE